MRIAHQVCIPITTAATRGRYRKTAARAEGPALQRRLRIAAEMNRSEARATRPARGTGAGARGGLRLHRQETLALHALARELARPANRFRLFAGLLFGGLFVVAAELHLAENALALHLLLQRLEGLVDIVVADENLHALFL